MNRIPGLLSKPCTLTINLVGLHLRSDRQRAKNRLAATRPPIARLARIKARLEAGELFNATTLAADEAVSIKTAQRDLDFIRRELGVELYYHPRAYSYALTPPEKEVA